MGFFSPKVSFTYRDLALLISIKNDDHVYLDFFDRSENKRRRQLASLVDRGLIERSGLRACGFDVTALGENVIAKVQEAMASVRNPRSPLDVAGTENQLPGSVREALFPLLAGDNAR